MTDTASCPSSPQDDSDYEDKTSDIPVPQENGGSPDAALSTTLPPAPCTEEDDIIAKHRRQFNLTAFGTTFNGKCRAKKRAKNHRMMTKFEYNKYISALHWNVEAGHFDPLPPNRETRETRQILTPAQPKLLPAF